jgi:hypothetical protein
LRQFIEINTLNNQFSSVFFNPDPKIKHTFEDKEKYPSMFNIKINKNGLLKLLLNIKEHKATGPDDIPGKLLKIVAFEILDIYQLLFQSSLNQG